MTPDPNHTQERADPPNASGTTVDAGLTRTAELNKDTRTLNPSDATRTHDSGSQADHRPIGPAGAAPDRLADYEILSELGHGGMGVVYKARQRKLNRIVALKMVLAGARAKPATIARFRAEALAVARLDHPNIIQIYDIGEHDGLPFFSMEFVDGGGLDRKMDHKPMEPHPAARLMATIARGMHYAHQKGVIHRDLKPANILLTKEGEPKVTDFGLAKQLEDADEQSAGTRTGVIMGTPNYMAPEQAEGNTKLADHRADVYSLGATFYEMLTGRPPFSGPSVASVLSQVRDSDPVSPSLLQPKMPKDAQTIALKCLQKDPAKRYQSAGDLADDLERFLDGRTIVARPVSSVEKLVRWCKRKKGLAAASFLAAALAVTLIATYVAYTLQLAEKNGQISRQRDDLDMANKDLAATTARVIQERDAAQRTGDGAYQMSRQLRRYVGEELKRNGLHRQRAELSKMVQTGMSRIERATPEGVAGLERNRVAYLLDLASQYSDEASLMPGTRADRLARAEEAIDKAFALTEPVAGPDSGDLPRANFALVLQRRGEVRMIRGNKSDGEADLKRSLTLRQELVDRPRSAPGTPDHVHPANALRSLADAHHTLVAYFTSERADPAALRSHLAEAVRLHQEALDLARREPASTDDVGGAERFERAVAQSLVVRAVITFADSLKDDPKVPNAVVLDPGGFARMAADLRTAVALDPTVLRETDAVERFLNKPLALTQALYREGLTRFVAGKTTDAHEIWSWADAVIGHAAPLADGDDTLAWDHEQARVLYALGAAELKRKNPAKAAAAFAECVTLRRRLLAADPTTPQKTWLLMVALARSGKFAEAIKLAEQEAEAQAKPGRESLAEPFWFQVACVYSLCAETVGGLTDDADPKADADLTEKLRNLRADYLSKATTAADTLTALKAKKGQTPRFDDPDLSFWRARRK
jgi:tRNA A-37 threonylcarbamoyl transferase component Bud32/tetratricopeptide (TPR) repeat protein